MEEFQKVVTAMLTANKEQIDAQKAQIDALLKVIKDQQKVEKKQPDPTTVNNKSNGAVEQCRALEALSNMIDPFVYDEESGRTFEAWYNRFRGVIAVGASNFDDKAKIELILMRLETSANALYRNSIAPNDPSTFTFDQTIVKLTDLFKKKVSLLRTRWNCLNIQRTSGEDIAAYGARVNQETVNFKLGALSEEQFKVLVFILGLQDGRDKSIRTRLLNLQDRANSTDAKDITLQAMVQEAERILQIETDSAIGARVDSVNLVHASNQHQSRQKSKSGKSNANRKLSSNASSNNTPRTPCWQCGALHYVKDCEFATHKCTRCEGIGHKEGYCKAFGNNKKNDKKKFNHQRNPQVKVVQLAVNSSSTTDKPMHKRLFVDVSINNVRLTLQLDTGSDITILSHSSWQQIGGPPLEKSSCRPVDCQGNYLEVIGEIMVEPQCNGKSIHGRCIIAKCDSDLFGLEWIAAFGLLEQSLATFCNKVTLTNQKKKDPAEFVRDLQVNFASVFAPTLGRCEQFKAALHLKSDARPVFRQRRPAPFHTMALISEELERLEQSEIITPVQFSLYAAPIVVVRKANGTIRLCGDYSTGLNDMLESHEYPIPTPEQIFASLANAKIFTQLDLSEAYLQIEMNDESRKLLTIHTHKGLYVFNRLCPGVKPAAGIFQQTMETIFAGLDIIIYFDDVLIASSSMEDHQRNIILVMERLAKFNLRLRFAKCKFLQSEVRYLGVIVDARGQRPDPAKVEAITSMPPPENLSQARSFLGAIGFYGRFIKSMSTIRAPIDNLMRKDTEFVWDKSCEAAFSQFKKILLSDLLLTHYDPSLPIMIAADASSTGIGCVAYHTHQDQSVKAFYHSSRRLTSAEQKYSQIEKEGLGIIFAVKKFHRYIWGRRFTIFTDHRPLLCIFGGKKGVPVHTANRLQRWAIILLGYDFEIKFIGTDDFGHADVLSRLIAEQPRSSEDMVIAQVTAEEERSIIEQNLSAFSPFTFEAIRQATVDDETMQLISKYISSGWPPKSAIQSRNVQKFFDFKNELLIAHDALIYRDRIVVPPCYRKRVLASLHQAHPGICRMKALARCYVFWPGIDSDIQTLVANCAPCQQAQKAPIKVPLSSWPTPPHPWFRVHADFAGPIDGRWYLIVIDSFSKWPEIFTLTSTTAENTIRVFREIIARHGCMNKLITDNGPQFTSVPFKQFCTSEAVEHITTAPYMPMSNGQAERFVDTFKRSMSKCAKLNDEAIQRFLRAYRSTPNERAPFGKSPAELIYGRRLRLPIAALLPPTATTPLVKDTKMENAFNKKHGARHRLFKEGDEVQYKQNPKSDWKIAKVIEPVGNVMYNIIADGWVRRVHGNQIRSRTKSSAGELDYLFDAPLENLAASMQAQATRKNWRAVDRRSPIKLRPRN